MSFSPATATRNRRGKQRGGGIKWSPPPAPTDPPSTSALFGATEADDRLNRAMKSADRILNMDDYNLSSEERRQVEAVSEQGFLERGLSGLMGLFDIIQRPADQVQLGIRDIFQLDRATGTEIEPEDYRTALSGREGREQLREKHGTYLLGKEGGFTTSAMLDVAGWSKGDEWYNNTGRFVAALAGDVFTDPLSYVTLSGSGVGKRALGEAAEGVVRRAAALAADDLAKGAVAVGKTPLGREALEDGFVKGLRSQIDDRARSIMDSKIAAIEDAASESIPGVGRVIDPADLDDPAADLLFDMDELWRDSVKQAHDQVSAEVRNEIAPKVFNRKFGSLGKDHADFVQHVNEWAPNQRFLQGGLRLMPHPFSMKNQTRALPGTPGLVEKLKSVTIEPISDRFPRIKQWRIAVASAIDAQKSPLMQAIEKGKYAYVSDLMKVSETVRHLSPEIAAKRTLRLVDELNTVMKKSGNSEQEAQELVDTIFKAMQMREVPGEVLSSGRYSEDVVAAYRRVIDELAETYDKAHSTLRGARPKVGFIANYVPVQLDDDWVTVVRAWKEQGLLPSITPETAAELGVSERDLRIFHLVASSVKGKSTSGVDVLGEAAAMHERQLGKTAVRKLKDEDDLVFLSDEVVAGFQDLDDISAAMANVTRAVAERNSNARAMVPRRVDMNVLNGLERDPVKMVSKYLGAVQQAAYEAEVIKVAMSHKGVLVKPKQYVDVVEKIAFELYGTEADPGVLRRMAATAEKMADDVEAARSELVGREIPMETVQVGKGLSVEVPAEVMEKPAVKQAVRRLREKVKKLDRHRADYEARLKADATRISNELGVPMEEARLLVGLRSESLNEVKAEMLLGTDEVAEEYEAFVIELLNATVRDMKEKEDLARLAAAAVDDFRRTSGEALERLEAEYVARHLGMGPQTYRLTALDPEVQAASLQVLADNLGDQVRVFADQVIVTLNAKLRRMNDELSRLGGATSGHPRAAELDYQIDIYVNAIQALQEYPEHAIHYMGRILKDEVYYEPGAGRFIDMTKEAVDKAGVTISNELPTTSVIAILREAAADPGTLEKLFHHKGKLEELLAVVSPWGRGTVVRDVLPDGRTRMAWVPEQLLAENIEETADAARLTLRDAINKQVKGELDPSELKNHLDLGDVIIFANLEAGLRRRVATNAARKGAQSKQLKSALQAMDDLKTIIDKWDGDAKELAEFLRPFHPKTGKRTDSAAWRNLKQYLPPEKAAQIENAMNAKLLVQDGRVSAATIRRSEAFWNGELWDDLGNAAYNLQQQALEAEQVIAQTAIDEKDEVLALLEEFQEAIVGLKGYAQDVGPDGAPPLAAATFRSDVAGEAFDEQRKAAAKLARRLSQEKGYEGLKKDADRLVNQTARVYVAQEGFSSPSQFGLAADLLEGYDIDPLVGLVFENMTATYKAMHTNHGMRELQRTVHQAYRWWKGAATIAKPAFHIRNFVSGVANGMLIGVGPKNYAAIYMDVHRLHKALGAGKSWDEALQTLSEKNRQMFTDAYDRGVLQTGFARGDLTVEGGKISANPFSPDFAAFKVGGDVMTDVEDLLRMAAFHKWYDGSQESADFARSMVMLVHFDYQNLTGLERQFKKIAPFFIWTRRNLPLQMRMIFEQPAYLATWSSVLQNIQEHYGDNNFNAYPVSPYASSLVLGLGTRRQDDEYWARFIFDPDIPLATLDELPIFKRDPGESFGDVKQVVDPVAWINWGVQLLGPAVSVPKSIIEKESWADVNAPVGLNEVLVLMDKAGIWDSQVSPQGDAQIPAWARDAFNTALPFYNNVTAGVNNDPNQRQRLGMREEFNFPDSIGAWLQSNIGSGFGQQLQTPLDAKSQTWNAEEFLRDLRQREEAGFS